ncbi:unnamed protein product [Strongylus vulgaris]|uniref:Uncharacterized protein n=1 Tax=Strongylus vulgaris TaxID=40348 RepID=A0A3P7IQ72_STRVU|nr:unnamed protein product [Strongylus vulgaris]
MESVIWCVVQKIESVRVYHEVKTTSQENESECAIPILTAFATLTSRAGTKKANFVDNFFCHTTTKPTSP